MYRQNAQKTLAENFSSENLRQSCCLAHIAATLLIQDHCPGIGKFDASAAALAASGWTALRMGDILHDTFGRRRTSHPAECLCAGHDFCSFALRTARPNFAPALFNLIVGPLPTGDM